MTVTATSRRRRRRPGPGWVPNQHGAWAMVLSPLLVGVVAGGPAWVHLPLAGFWLVGYFAFFATAQWLKARRRARWFPPVRAYGLAAVLLGAVVVLMEPPLLRWAPAFLAPLGVGLWAASRRRERDLVAGLATVAGACLMTPVAADAGAGAVDQRAWLLALVQLLYFAGTVFYVKSAIRERDNRAFLALSVGYHVVATAVAWWLSWPLGLLFALLAARALLVPPRRLSPKTLGIGEVVATLAVAAVSLAVL